MDRQKRAEELAVQILKYARNELLVAFRFLDLALCKPEYQTRNIETLGIDGKYFRFSPDFIFELYKQGGGELNHSYLHSVFHCVFSHPFVNPAVNRDLWDLACDIAVEVAALEQGGKLTAERLYKCFMDKPPSPGEYQRLHGLFRRDEHGLWYEPPEQKENTLLTALIPDRGGFAASFEGRQEIKTD